MKNKNESLFDKILKYEMEAAKKQFSAQQYLENQISPNDLTEDVRKTAMRAYEIARDIFAPTFIYFCEGILNDLNKNPNKLCLCLGRDGISQFILLKKLLRVSKKRWPNVNINKIQYCNISRKIKDKALADAGFEYQPGREGEEDKKYQKDKNSKNYKDYLKKYLDSLGMDTADEIIIIDNGVEGSIQTALEALFPEKKFHGQYLTLFRDERRTLKENKVGYLVEAEGDRNLLKNGYIQKDKENSLNLVNLNGEIIYLEKDAIYLLEDLLNGTFNSNEGFESVPDYKKEIATRLRPMAKRATLEEGLNTDPDLILTDFKKASVYQLFKKLVLKGIMDAAILRESQRDLDPEGKNRILHSNEKARKWLTNYVEAFLAFRRGQKSSDSAWTNEDELLTDFLVRRKNYKEITKLKKWTHEAIMKTIQEA